MPVVLVATMWLALAFPNLISTRSYPLELWVLLGGPALASSLGIEQLLALRTLEGALGIASSFLNLARFYEALLGVIIFTGCPLVTFAFIDRRFCLGLRRGHVAPHGG